MFAETIEALIKTDARLLHPNGQINQGMAARALKIPQPTLHRILHGVTAMPRKEFIDSVANYFGVTPAYVRGEEESSPLPEARLTADEISLLAVHRSFMPSEQPDVLALPALFHSLTGPQQKTALRLLSALKG